MSALKYANPANAVNQNNYNNYKNVSVDSATLGIIIGSVVGGVCIGLPLLYLLGMLCCHSYERVETILCKPCKRRKSDTNTSNSSEIVPVPDAVSITGAPKDTHDTISIKVAQ
jgi:hypothetical protein